MKFGNHIVQIFFRVRTVAFLAGIDIQRPLHILDAETDHGLGVGLQYGKIDQKVGFEEIRSEIEGRAVTEGDFFIGPFKQIKGLDPVFLFHAVVAEGFKGVGGCLPVFAVGKGDPFADHDLLDAPFLEEDDHVFQNSGGGDDAEGGKGTETAPENDVGFDEHPCI